jgi:hypothetical protein
MKGGLDATGSLGKDKSNEGIDSTKFDVLYQLNPGSPLTKDSCCEIWKLAFSSLYRLDAIAKSTFLGAIADLIDYVLNEDSPIENKRKVKKPSTEIVSWLNLFGSLAAVVDDGVIDLPDHFQGATISVCFAADGGKSQDLEYNIPINDVS